MFRVVMALMILSCLITGCGKKNDPVYQSSLLLKKTSFKVISLDDYSVGSKSNHIKNPRVVYLKGNTKEIFNKMSNYKNKINSLFHFGEFSRIFQSFKNFDRCFESNSIGSKTSSPKSKNNGSVDRLKNKVKALESEKRTLNKKNYNIVFVHVFFSFECFILKVLKMVGQLLF